MNWKINAALVAALLALFALIFFVPMEHDIALILGLISMVLFLLIVASAAMASLRWVKGKLRTARH